MVYKDLLIGLIDKVGLQKKICMEMEDEALLISCCLFASLTEIIPLPIQHYVYKQKQKRSLLEPFFEIQTSKIFLKQKIPLHHVESIRAHYSEFTARAKDCQKDLENLSFSFI